MSEERLKRDAAAWDVVAAIACFVIAVLSLAIGFVLTTRWLLDDHVHPTLHGVGLVLLIIGVPMMILGGHFMDLGERKRRHGDRREAAVSR